MSSKVLNKEPIEELCEEPNMKPSHKPRKEPSNNTSNEPSTSSTRLPRTEILQLRVGYNEEDNIDAHYILMDELVVETVDKTITDNELSNIGDEEDTEKDDNTVQTDPSCQENEKN